MRCINREFVWVGGGGRDGKSGLGILSVKEKLKNQLKISLFLMRWIGFIWGWVGGSERRQNIHAEQRNILWFLDFLWRWEDLAKEFWGWMENRGGVNCK